MANGHQFQPIVQQIREHPFPQINNMAHFKLKYPHRDFMCQETVIKFLEILRSIPWYAHGAFEQNSRISVGPSAMIW